MDEVATIASQLSNGLTYLLLGDDAKEFGSLPKAVLAGAKEFDGWEPYDATKRGTGNEGFTGGPIDCVMAMPIDSDEAWCFNRVANLSVKHWRGRISFFPPQSFDFMFRSINNDGIAVVSLRVPIVRTPVAVKVHPQLRNPRSQVTHLVEEIAAVLLDPGVPMDDTIAAISTHRKRYYWNIYVGFPGYPRARLATDAKGVRAFFNDREVGASGRRDALIHWVSGHWRKRRPPNEADVLWVRDHLRGQRDFAWNGMRGEVIPAPV